MSEINIPKNPEHIEAMVESEKAKALEYINSLDEETKNLMTEAAELSAKFKRHNLSHLFLIDSRVNSEVFTFMKMIFGYKKTHENLLSEEAQGECRTFIACVVLAIKDMVKFLK